MSAWTQNVAEPWADAMSYALAHRYGRWALGWRWALGEGDFDGGPVGSWCCPSHSVTTTEETLDRVVAALLEWRGWLESLAGWFAVHPLEADALDDRRVLWERTARCLILHVADRTGCDSGWYGHCRQVLTWFLDSRGVAPGTARELVDRAIGGRFESWVAPDTAVVDGVAERLALSLRPADLADRPAAPPPDHLECWLAVRATVPWHTCPDGSSGGPAGPPRDGAVEDVRAFDAAIDPARARGLLAALGLVRADAARGAALDVDLLRGWQRHVLGALRPPPFRTLPAFAKQGRERYGIAPDTRDRLDACLAESAGPLLPLPARAARAHLDVCFFHPFDDGNARAAFLALVFVLAREGVALRETGLLRRIALSADSPEDALTLARLISHCL
ncbi:Fic family protein [Actinomadura parmotrematis]|uniref:Fic family protein n=1 Tax=Actinomadura parmotrematis TaxID=2864039 RepID=A0ABS7FLD1_9ACTN|nr:Fic family protein [Actinomadura parmotrematis]MBW8481060.1 Fic family protein [Actinomadura parmotrematis]